MKDSKWKNLQIEEFEEWYYSKDEINKMQNYEFGYCKM